MRVVDFVFGADVGEITDEREHRERAGHGERNGGDGGRWGKDCPIAHGDEGEGVIFIFNGLLSFCPRIWAEVGGAGGSVWRWRHRSIHCCCCCCFVVRPNCFLG